MAPHSPTPPPPPSALPTGTQQMARVRERVDDIKTTAFFHIFPCPAPTPAQFPLSSSLCFSPSRLPFVASRDACSSPSLPPLSIYSSRRSPLCLPRIHTSLFLSSSPCSVLSACRHFPLFSPTPVCRARLLPPASTAISYRRWRRRPRWPCHRQAYRRGTASGEIEAMARNYSARYGR